MTASLPSPQAALRYETEVNDHGQIELRVPYATGSRVTIIVIPETHEQFPELVAASSSSLAFWDNPLDDEDWNAA